MMKIFILIALTCISCSWTKPEITKEVCYGILNATEVEQTVYGIEKLGREELNSLYGKHPSEGRVRIIGIVTGLGHFLVTNYIWEEYRDIWQNTTLAFKVFGTGWNFRVILRR